LRPSEFKFWLQATRATLFSLLLSLTRASDIPVYWPILLIYFITCVSPVTRGALASALPSIDNARTSPPASLFGLTMRRQIAHMVKYKCAIALFLLT
jgi:hypothetical protein